MSPPGFNQDSSQSPPSISGMDQASPPHTYLPPCHLPYMSLTALLSSHTAPAKALISLLFFCLSNSFYFFMSNLLMRLRFQKGSRGKGQQITSVRLFEYLHCLATEENCFYVGLHFLIVSVNEIRSDYIKRNPIWIACIWNWGVGYRLLCKHREEIIISSLRLFPPVCSLNHILFYAFKEIISDFGKYTFMIFYKEYT